MIEIETNLEALIAGVDPSHSDTDESAVAPEYNRLRALTPTDLQSAIDAFGPVLEAGILAEVDGAARGFSLQGVLVPEVGDTDVARLTQVMLAAPLEEGDGAITWAWSPDFGPIVLRALDDEGQGYADILEGGERSEAISLEGSIVRSWGGVFVDYVRSGFDHIIPLGADHILFVLWLYFLSAKLSPLLWQVTAFTAAHTVTLALGATGVLTIPPSIVEPLIALSIVYVGVENILSKGLSPWRPALVFGFGLLHGLGFAGVLGEFGLPEGQFVPALLGFNVGVEFGQLAVILACFVTVGIWFGAKPWYDRVIRIPASLFVAAVGAYWVLERTVL